MNARQPLDRRAFLAELGRGAFAVAIVGLAGCATNGGSSPPTSRSSGAPSGGASAPPSSARPGGGVTWDRVDLGFVSAYVLVRGGEAAIVDTGIGGSADAIGQSLTALGLDWSAVGHLILTHHHRDHVGSAGDVLQRAPDAIGYAGAEDIPAITVPRPLTAVADGDRVFDLEVVTTPGHTAGSICVLDAVGGILVAGDALRTDGGRPTLPGEQFTVDMDEAKRSIAKLGGLTFETLLVGHGEPIEDGGSRAVAELAASG